MSPPSLHYGRLFPARLLFTSLFIFIYACTTSSISTLHEVQYINTTVSWGGGVATDCWCANNSQPACCDGGTTYSTNFACNIERFPFFGNRPGNWNNGTNSFYVSVPESFLVTQINITFMGRFKCAIPLSPTPDNNILSVTVGAIEVTTKTFQSCAFCDYCSLCDACEVPFFVATEEIVEGWPGWHYHQNNTIMVTVQQGVVCLSSAFISLRLRARDIPILTGLTTGADDDDSEFALPLYGIILLSVGGLVCVVVVVVVFVLALLNHMEKGRTTPILGGMVSFIFGDHEKGKHSPLLKGSKGSGVVTEKQMAFEEIVTGRRIGKGSYGEVFLGTWRGTEVAVKKLPYYVSEIDDGEQDMFIHNFIQETELMKSLRHPNIIPLYAAFTYPEVCMVMEYMPRGSLYSILHNKSIDLSWDLLRRIMIDAAKGMTYLHNSRPVIVHRDLKSHNLLVGEHWRTKVSDFGLSRMIEMSAIQTMTSCGTPSWTAPEVLRGEKYTEKCDVYSFGIVLWECVTRENPHEGIPHFQIVFQVGTQGLRPKIPSDCPHAWARLIADCWAEGPDERPDFQEILSRLEKF